MILRDYQLDGIEQLYFKWRTSRKIVWWGATGSGKGEVISFLAKDCLSDKMPVVIVMRGRELVKNISERLDKYKIPHSVFMAGDPRFDRSKLVQICSVDTMKSRDSFPFVDSQAVVLIDEAHKSYDNVFEKYKTQYIVGFTATPFSDMSDYDDYVCSIEPYELRDMGALVPEKIFCPHVIDTSSLNIVAGDFKRDQVEQLVTNGEIVGNVIKDYIELGENRPTVCFAVSVEHSKQLRDEFLKSGITAVHCDASSTNEERKNAKDGVENGTIKIVCNVDIFSVGWDCPAISCVILARPTWSLIWYLQAIGRGLRPHRDKVDCIVLDNAGNVFRHGTPYRSRNISLSKPERKTKKDYNPDEAVRTCLNCYAVYESKLIDCPYCGEKPPIREIKKINGKLAIYNESEEERHERKKEECQVMYHKLTWVAKKRNLSKSWIKQEIIKKYGEEFLPYVNALLNLSNLRK